MEIITEKNSVSAVDMLSNMLEQNQKRIGEIKANFVHLSALSIPSLAIIYQTLGQLPRSINDWPLRLVIVGVAVHFMAVFVTLILSVVKPLEMKPLIWLCKKRTKCLHSTPKDIKTQFTYHHEESGAKRFFELLSVWIIPIFRNIWSEGTHEAQLTEMVLLTGAEICCLEKFTKYSIFLYAIALVFYGSASLMYILHV